MAILDQILAALTSVGGASAVIAVVVEFILRLIPSEKPLSILHLVAAIVRKLSAVLLALADLLDKVLPQKLAPPQA